MKLESGDWIVVSDGIRAVVFMNRGTVQFPELRALRVYDHNNPRTYQFGRRPLTRLAALPHLHQIAEDRFVAYVVDQLEQDALKNAFSRVVMAAPPAALRRFQRIAGDTLRARVRAWIDEDLTTYSAPAIAAAILRAVEI